MPTTTTTSSARVRAGSLRLASSRSSSRNRCFFAVAALVLCGWLITKTHAGCDVDNCHDRPLAECDLSTCSGYHNLGGKRLTGTIPSSLGSLSALSYMWLYGNELTGTIPSSLGSLSALTRMWLYDNALTGTIPSSLGSLSALYYMYLYDNALIGTIPSSLGSLSALYHLYLHNNQLTGTIPSSIVSLSVLEFIFVFGNDIANICNVSLSSSAAQSVMNFELQCATDMAQVEILALQAAVDDVRTSQDNMTALQATTHQLSGAVDQLEMRDHEQDKATSRLNRTLARHAADLNATQLQLDAVQRLALANAGAIADTRQLVASQADNTTSLYRAGLARDATLAVHNTQLQELQNASDIVKNNVEPLIDAQQTRIEMLEISVAELNATLLNVQAKLDTCEASTQTQQLDIDTLYAQVAANTEALERSAMVTSPASFVSSSTQEQPSVADVFGGDAVVAGVGAGGALVLVAVVAGIAACFVQRNKKARKLAVGAVGSASAHGRQTVGLVATHKAVQIAFDDGAYNGTSSAGVPEKRGKQLQHRSRTIACTIQRKLGSDGELSWESLQSVVALVRRLVELGESVTQDEECRGAIENALKAFHEVRRTFQLQLDVAAAEQEYATAEFYKQRLHDLSRLASAFPAAQCVVDTGGGDSSAPRSPTAVASFETSEKLECVAPGLLLRRDRFAGEHSPAFLGRGASSAVSRGTLTEIVGSTRERRTAVAVKEVSRSVAAGEQKVVRELVVVNEKVGAHPNIVRILTAKFTGSTCYIVMELCHFSLDKQPRAFQDMLHTGDSGIGALVLNALLQDLVRGTAFLHARGVFHCDIKPANVLVAFDRVGQKKRKQTLSGFRPEYFKAAQLKLADFGVSRIIRRQSSGVAGPNGGGQSEASFGVHASTTATVSLEGLDDMKGVAGTEAYMCPELLRVVRDLKSGKGLAGSVEIADSVLEANDAFGVGCVVGFLCSRGIHPFDSGRGRDVADNILANKRNKACLRQIKEARHLELLKRLTAHERQQQWTMALAEQHSRIFDAAMSLSGTTTASGHFDAGVLLDMIQFRERPRGSCRDQLLQPGLVDHFPELPALVEELERLLRDGRRSTSLRLARPLLDEDSHLALLAFTYDNGVDRESNIYYRLNKAVRHRAQEPEVFQRWRGFLFFLMAALDQLPTHQGLVYRGGNEGVDQSMVKREYKAGRVIQWAAFSSATARVETAKEFVDPAVGVLFKLSVVNGRHIGEHSYLPREAEVLLSPNTRFVVSRAPYVDSDGYVWVDMVETSDHVALKS